MLKRSFVLFLFLSAFSYNVKSQDTFYFEDNNFSSEQNIPFTQEVKDNIIRVAILLPFGVKEKTNPANLQPKMVEYYEGFLLALDDLKKMGLSIDVQVEDIGNDIQYLEPILQADDLKDKNLIIGGFTEEQIKLLSDFSVRHEISYLVPFASKCYEVWENPFLFQINAPAGYLYAKVSQAFINKYKKYNIIFLQENNADKADFIQSLKDDLAIGDLYYHTINYSDKFVSDLQSILAADKRNVIIPASGKEFLLKILSELATLKQTSQYKLTLFGYPEWQTYDLGTLAGNLHDLNTTIYSNFYIKQNVPKTCDFYKKFLKWYSRPIANTYPKFSVWGFDTAMFFLQVINKYGASFGININNFKYEGIQTNFYYQRVDYWGGFINANVFFVNFNDDFSITRETK